jgi:hypothetical protein
MSNKSIAINWAQKQVRSARGFVYSDAFFKPFTNLDTRKKITRELAKVNVVVWSDTKDGAFIFRKSDSRLEIVSDGQIQVGVWTQGADTESPQVIILPAMPVVA